MKRTDKGIEMTTIKIKYIPIKIRKIILELHPEWTEEDSIKEEEISYYQKKYLEKVLINHDIITKKTGNEIVESLMSDEFKPIVRPIVEEQNLTRGEKVADKIAEFGGSWKFIGLFGFVLFVWILINSLAILNFDKYPFILLNLVLSCLAAIQAPIIMMSQNRHEARDRQRGENDYITNLKAEVEIRLLDEKIDCVLNEQIPDLLAINSAQFELIKEQQKDIKELLEKIK